MNDEILLDDETSTPPYFGITKENVYAIRAFTGEGIMSANAKLKQAQGDPLLAVGLLKYEGCLVNYKNGDGSARISGMAKSWAAGLQMVDGVIGYKAKESDIESPSP